MFVCSRQSTSSSAKCAELFGNASLPWLSACRETGELGRESAPATVGLCMTPNGGSTGRKRLVGRRAAGCRATGSAVEKASELAHCSFGEEQASRERNARGIRCQTRSQAHLGPPSLLSKSRELLSEPDGYPEPFCSPAPTQGATLYRNRFGAI